MALFISGLCLVLLFGVAYLGPRFVDFNLVYDALAQLGGLLRMEPDSFIRIIPLVGAVMMVLGNRQMLMADVTCDECGWVGPKRRFIQGCKECGSHLYH